MADKKYVVTAPYVTLKTATPNGVMLMGFFAGAPVPGDVPAAQLKHHLDSKLIAEVKSPVAVPDAELHPSPLTTTNTVTDPAEAVAAGEAAREAAREAAAKELAEIQAQVDKEAAAKKAPVKTAPAAKPAAAK